MPLTAKVLFGQPQHEIASMLVGLLQKCRSVWIVTGFATVEGVEAIAAPLRHAPGKLQALVIGAGTGRGFDALDRLLDKGVPRNRLFVHLGHTQLTGPKAKHRFYRYHPMLHSKVYLFEMDGGTSVAVIGSHNVTGFALMGLNGEAAVALEGPSDDPEIRRIKAHVESCIAEASPYSTAMKEGFTWWTSQFVDGLRAKVNDTPREYESRYTIIVMATAASGLPREGDAIYFEVPLGLARLRSLGAEVHIYVFDQQPPTATDALALIGGSRSRFWCKITNLGDDQRVTEVAADWHIRDRMNPVLEPAKPPFRPKPAADMMQVLVTVHGRLFDVYEYLFGSNNMKWLPVLQDEDGAVQANPEHRTLLAGLNLIPAEHGTWSLVKDLEPVEPEGDEPFVVATKALLPTAGSYILVSARRRKL
jgi:hypothetical protein